MFKISTTLLEKVSLAVNQKKLAPAGNVTNFAGCAQCVNYCGSACSTNCSAMCRDGCRGSGSRR